MAYEAFMQPQGEPDHVNEAGFEFRCELGLTRYAMNKLGNSWIVWKVSGNGICPTYLLCNGGVEQFDNNAYEAICCHVDALAFSMRCGEK